MSRKDKSGAKKDQPFQFRPGTLTLFKMVNDLKNKSSLQLVQEYYEAMKTKRLTRSEIRNYVGHRLITYQNDLMKAKISIRNFYYLFHNSGNYSVDLIDELLSEDFHTMKLDQEYLMFYHKLQSHTLSWEELVAFGEENESWTEANLIDYEKEVNDYVHVGWTFQSDWIDYLFSQEEFVLTLNACSRMRVDDEGRDVRFYDNAGRFICRYDYDRRERSNLE